MGIENRGFGSLKKKDPEKLRRLGSEGGKKAHALGKAHRFTTVEARIAVLRRMTEKARKENEKLYTPDPCALDKHCVLHDGHLGPCALGEVLRGDA